MRLELMSKKFMKHVIKIEKLKKVIEKR